MRKLFGLLAAAIFIGTSLAAASADSTPAVTQSYNADSSVLAGMIVGPKPNVANTVVPLTSQGINRMLGVVVPVNDAPLVLTSTTATSQQVLVANSGRYNMLVSNQGGAIRAGDYLTISSLSGIGTKASSSQTEVVGQAAGSFDGSNALGSVPLKNGSGKTVTESIGSIPVNVQLAANPLFQKTSTELPSFLAKTADTVANKHVNAARVYLGVLTLLATVVIAGSLLYGGASSSVVAIGRNPLAKRAIGSGMFRVAIMGLIVFMLGLLATYLMLRL